MPIQNEPIVIKSFYAPAPEAPDFALIYRSAIIRLGVENDYGQPYYHSFTNHARVGIMGYGATGHKVQRDSEGDLIIKGAYVGPGEQVSTLRPVLDESLAKRGFFVGCSGGAEQCEMRLYRDNPNGEPVHIRADSSIFDGDLFNVWFSSVGVVPVANLPETLVCQGSYGT